MHDYKLLNLQLLADGGDGGASGGIGADAGPVSGNPGTDNQEQEPQKASFEQLLKSNPDYKAAYDAKLTKALEGRFAKQKTIEDRQKKLDPIMDVLAGKYGLSRGDDGYDLEALSKAIDEDKSYYEEEALRRGMSVEELKRFKHLERENDQFRRTMEERERQEASQKAWGKVMQQAEEAKQVYPSLDIDAEMQNPGFGRLVAAGVPVRTAYEVVHRDEIMGGAMQYTAQQTAQKISNAVAAGARRPNEGGMGAGSSAETKMDPAKLTKEQRAEIRKRVLRGEAVTFD